MRKLSLVVSFLVLMIFCVACSPFSNEELLGNNLDSYQIKVSDVVENGEIITSINKAKEGEIVKVNVYAHPGYEYVLDSLTIDGEKISNNEFVMPNKEVVLEADFTLVDNSQVKDVNSQIYLIKDGYLKKQTIVLLNKSKVFDLQDYIVLKRGYQMDIYQGVNKLKNTTIDSSKMEKLLLRIAKDNNIQYYDVFLKGN